VKISTSKTKEIAVLRPKLWLYSLWWWKKLRPYLKENTCLNYKDHAVNAVYCENHMKPINTQCGKMQHYWMYSRWYI
jgi:hypothetical protein